MPDELDVPDVLVELGVLGEFDVLDEPDVLSPGVILLNWSIQFVSANPCSFNCPKEVSKLAN